MVQRKPTDLVLILIIIASLFVLASGLGIIPEQGDLLSVSQGTCSVGRISVATVRCDVGSQTQTQRTDFDTDVFTIEYYPNARVDLLDTGSTDTGWIKDIATNNFVCHDDPIFGARYPDCNNALLTYGRSYKVGHNELLGNIRTFRIIGTPTILTYSDAFGANDVVIPNTEGCVSQQIIQDLRNANIQVSGKEPEFIERINVVQNMRPPQTFTFDVAYQEIASISIDYDNGRPVSCRQNVGELWGYEQVNSYYDGSCWLVEGSRIKDIDCCSTQYCKETIGPDYSCENYECKFEGTSTEGCNTDRDCGDSFCNLESDGSNTFFHPYCDTDKPQIGHRGTCQETEEPNLECCPDTNYPNNQCCLKNAQGEYELQDCNVPLRSCKETFGENACCLENQDSYTLQECGDEFVCCGASDDGIGTCEESCSPSLSLFDKLIEQLKQLLKDLLGIDVDLETAKWILIAIAAFAIFFIVFSRRTGPSGYVGSYPIIPPRYAGPVYRGARRMPFGGIYG